MKDFIVKDNLTKNMDFKSPVTNFSSASSSASSSSSTSPINVMNTCEDVLLAPSPDGSSSNSNLHQYHTPSPPPNSNVFDHSHVTLSQFQQNMTELQQGIAQVCISADGDSSLLNVYLERLQELIPWAPKDESLSKLQVVQAVIDYINLLQEQLESPNSDKVTPNNQREKYLPLADPTASGHLSAGSTGAASQPPVRSDLFNTNKHMVDELSAKHSGNEIYSPRREHNSLLMEDTALFTNCSNSAMPHMQAGCSSSFSSNYNFSQNSNNSIPSISDDRIKSIPLGLSTPPQYVHEKHQHSRIFPFPPPPSPQTIKAARKKKLQNKRQQQESVKHQQLLQQQQWYQQQQLVKQQQQPEQLLPQETRPTHLHLLHPKQQLRVQHPEQSPANSLSIYSAIGSL